MTHGKMNGNLSKELSTAPGERGSAALVVVLQRYP